jgi:hypothetical protein
MEKLDIEVAQQLSKLNPWQLPKPNTHSDYMDYLGPHLLRGPIDFVYDFMRRPALAMTLYTTDDSKTSASVLALFQRYPEGGFWVLGSNFCGETCGWPVALDNWDNGHWKELNQLLRGESLQKDTTVIRVKPLGGIADVTSKVLVQNENFGLQDPEQVCRITL